MKSLLFALAFVFAGQVFSGNTMTTTHISDNEITESECRQLELTFLHTSDIHGAVLSYNYLRQENMSTGLPFVFAYADSLRRQMGDRLILTDGGDCLQGQPTAYYYNFVDTVSPHLITSVMNQMGYVCSVMGNHDIEAGHPVYDRWVRELHMPVLGANVVSRITGRPYLQPYTIVERCGLRIALLGMVTPTIPFWLPEVLWQGLDFQDIETSSRHWIQYIRDHESPNLIVGVFHSGFDGGIVKDGLSENAVQKVAQNVPGYDLILYGHDHHAAIHEVCNTEGDTVTCIGSSSDGIRMAQVRMTLTLQDGRIVAKHVEPQLPYSNVCRESLVAQMFEAEFMEQKNKLSEWVGRPIGTLTQDMDGMDAYFGPSLFIDFIHQMQLDLTGADISFAAPLTYNAVIKAGTLRVSDMFNLYKYENFLYTMRLTGREIKGFLEMSYALWTNQMTRPEDHIMLMKQNDRGEYYFPNMTFNFDSAAGILYTVDVTQPVGKKICIKSMANGEPFLLDKEYLVAVNSYRGNGGGELLTEGAGIPRQELASRIVRSTDKDLRFYMMQLIEKKGTIVPGKLNHWHFVPEEWAVPACERDRKLLMK